MSLRFRVDVDAMVRQINLAHRSFIANLDDDEDDDDDDDDDTTNRSKMTPSMEFCSIHWRLRCRCSSTS